MQSLISLKPSIKLIGDKTFHGDVLHNFMGLEKQFYGSWIVCVDGGSFVVKSKAIPCLGSGLFV